MEFEHNYLICDELPTGSKVGIDLNYNCVLITRNGIVPIDDLADLMFIRECKNKAKDVLKMYKLFISTYQNV